MLKHLGLEPRDLAKYSLAGQIGKVAWLRTKSHYEVPGSSPGLETINKEYVMSSQYNISNRKPQKILFDTYREYRIYKIIDARNNVYYNAESDYLTQGLIDATGNTIEVLQAKIDKIYARVHLLNMIKRTR